MEIRGISGGPGPDWGLDWSLLLRQGHRQPGLTPDLVAIALSQLATPEIGSMLTTIEDRRLAVDPQVAATVIREVTVALEQGHPTEALARINALLRAMPGIADTLRREPALEPIRNEVEALLRGVAAERKQVLEPLLARATELVDTNGPIQIATDGTDTRVMLAVAMRFIELGRLPDLIRAEELIGSVLNRYRLPVRPLVEAADNWLGRTADRVARLWTRAPLLILLLGWMILGLYGIIGVKAWALGLLALVGFGFIARVRHIRF